MAKERKRGNDNVNMLKSDGKVYGPSPEGSEMKRKWVGKSLSSRAWMVVYAPRLACEADTHDSRWPLVGMYEYD